MLLAAADDLTGACDSGIHFARAGEAIVSLNGAMPAEAPAALIVNTASRLLAPDQAARAVAEAARKAAAFKPGLIFKKIDSALRGNIASELEALLAASGAACALIAPAFPAMGRTARDGQLLVDGRPIHETDFANDPANPIRQADIIAILKEQGLAGAALIDWRVIKQGAEAVGAAVEALLARGARHIVFDGESDADLAAVAEAGQALALRPVYAGAAGLAKALAARLPASAAGAPKLQADKILFICGSAHGNARLQLRELAKAGISVARLPEAGGDAAVVEQCAAWLGEGACAIAAPEARLAKGAPDPSARLARAALALAALPQCAGAAFCIAGGETASAFLSGVCAFLRLERELAPGVIAARIQDGPLQGALAITKAGSFGGPGALVDVLNLISTGRRDGQ